MTTENNSFCNYIIAAVSEGSQQEASFSSPGFAET
jgi:hypothetical protein